MPPTVPLLEEVAPDRNIPDRIVPRQERAQAGFPPRPVAFPSRPCPLHSRPDTLPLSPHARALSNGYSSNTFSRVCRADAHGVSSEEDTRMSSVPDRATFENLYAGKAPWDIGKPQSPFAAVAGQVASPVLDAGCGTGDNA